ncbi:MAG TPA: asparagine synthase (glutamine-hydrolyzing) [Gammaproteobacteria bacterium]|nr:asparagine synthase (glutamine-hydrolyzing) [Gammaproteobacteria bacterium]
MCGIAAIFEYRNRNAVDQAALMRVRERMHSRGPDGAGSWLDGTGCLGLAHRRLAIIDLTEQAAQPMQDESGRYVIVFNGEIYNYRALREELKARGRRFRTRSDTEVLVNAIAEYGPEGLEKLRGMFAFALWDNDEQSLLLARDPYGIKPLYYADDGSRLLVASQVKALLASDLVDSAADPAGWVGFLLFGSVPEPWTTFAAIRELPAGSWLRVTPEGVGAAQTYAAPGSALSRESRGTGEKGLAEDVRTALLDSVRSHLTADVPVGAFLSAGVDSGSLVALMRDAGYEDIRTVTLGFEEFRGTPADEVPLAEATARRYETEHTTRMIGREEFLTHWPKILHDMDQPSVDGVNTWLVSKAAHEAGLKVVVSGIGGDELFGGYPGFRQIPRWVRSMQRLQVLPLAARTGYLMARGAARLSARVPPKLPAVFRYGHTVEGAYFARRGLFMPWELTRILDPDFARAGLEALDPLAAARFRTQPRPTTANGKLIALESALYLRNQLLRDSDWASMAHSLELRTPLVDWQLLNEIGPALASRSAPGKRLFAAAPSRPLDPAQVVRAKTGFGVPLGEWLGDWAVNHTANRVGGAASARAMARRLAEDAHRSCTSTSTVGEGTPPYE